MPFKWFIDVSSWKKLTPGQLAELIEHGCCGIAIKAAQGDYRTDLLLEYNVNLANQFNLPFVLFHWADPIKNAVTQADYFHSVVEKYKPTGICVDMEQYWMDWGQWHQQYVEHVPNAITKKFTTDQLHRFYYSYVKAIKKAFPNLPILAYSGTWFIHGYCRQLAVTIRDEGLYYWNAYYFAWKQMDKQVTVTWPEFEATVNSLNPSTKFLPSGISTWSAWQFAILPMINFPTLDCNIITKDAADVFFSKTPSIPIPEPSPQPDPIPEPVPGTSPVLSTLVYKVDVDDLYVRTSPSTSATPLRMIHKGDQVVAYDVGGANSWIKISGTEDEWVCVQLGKKVFLKK
jgi:hypothetical protein